MMGALVVSKEPIDDARVREVQSTKG
jgi:hypothetical protein